MLSPQRFPYFQNKNVEISTSFLYREGVPFILESNVNNLYLFFFIFFFTFEYKIHGNPYTLIILIENLSFHEF